MALPWHLYLMAALYFFAGINHFRKPRLYLKIIPNYIPYPKFVNYLSGFFEILIGIGLCIPEISNIAAWATLFLLIAVFPANIFMLTDEKANMRLPRWILIARLPLQIVLLIWAYYYT